MIKVDKVSIETINGRKLISDLSFTLNDGDKLAIIGEEGNGKSTLLKALYNKNLIIDYARVYGTITKTDSYCGFLEQKLSLKWNKSTVLDYFLKDDADGEINYEIYEKLYLIENILKSLNFNTEYLDNGQIIENLSGGERVKLQLAKLMFFKPSTLFLDEPTNDLDIETLKLLQDFICKSTGIVVFISHDETLLENTANAVLHIEQLIRKTQPKATFKRISYLEYVKQRKQSIEHQTQIAYSERREKEKKEAVLRQIKQKVENSLNASKKDPSTGRIVAKKMANIISLEKRYNNEETTEVPDVEEAINIIIDNSLKLPQKKEVLNLSLKELKAGEKVLAKNVRLQVIGPEKIAIIGNNGSGKSTLIKQIVPILKGTIGISVGYFSQNYYEILNYNATAADEIQTIGFEYNPRTLLGSLKFTAEEMDKKISELSEGQKAKIALIKIVTSKNNVLVLDEPTRNLSPLSNPVIRKMLKGFNGAIITVSHDRKFISEICDKVYKLNSDGLTLCCKDF